MELGNKLLELRKNNGFSQEELAEKVEISRQTISKWELNESSPDLKQAKQLSKIFKVSLDELVDNDIKDILTEKVSNTEKLAGFIYKFLKFLSIFFISSIVISIILFITFINLTKVNVASTVAEFSCNLNGEKYTISAKIENEDNKIVELTGNSEIINILDLEKYEYLDQVFNKVNEYFESNGGSCPKFNEN